jgi:uncharacterized protein GlcG (DUF336 family)
VISLLIYTHCAEENRMNKIQAAILVVTLTFGTMAKAQDCSKLPNHQKLKASLTEIVKKGKDVNGGMGNQMWAVAVNRDGIVCAVVFSGPDRSAQWPGSRLIAAEKANTANALSLPNFSLATGNLYAAAQPGGSLYGLASSPPNPQAAFAGPPEKFGQPDDPLVGKPIGGIIVFGGGLALYSGKGQVVGGLGVSGDTACTDHVVAWRLRHNLGLDAIAVGVGPNSTDNLILDIQNGSSASGFGHPDCKGGKPSGEIIKKLTDSDPVGP